MLLIKAASQLLLPPGGLIVLGLIGLFCWRKSWGRALVFLSLACLWLLATEPVRDLLISPLENRYAALEPDDLAGVENQAIVLLGGGIYERAPEYQGRDSLGPAALMRTVYAADLAGISGLDVYTTGGSVLSEGTEPEGKVMRRRLIRLGVPAEKVHSESESRNTWENAANLKQMLDAAGVEKVVLVTTAWHMPRSIWIFESNGFQVVPAPCNYVASRIPYDIRSYLPHWNKLADSADALHEYLGMLWYRLRYP